MPKVVAVLGAEAALGFALTGVEVIRVPDPAAARGALQEAVENGEHGLVIVEEALLDSLDADSREALFQRNLPLVIPVRLGLRWTSEGKAAEDDYVARLIRHAVGYQLNIQL
jgi:vacuolar-type H+-ATPase subunit F/Vma7